MPFKNSSFYKTPQIFKIILMIPHNYERQLFSRPAFTRLLKFIKRIKIFLKILKKVPKINYKIIKLIINLIYFK